MADHHAEQKKKGVLLATAGLLLALGVIAGFKLVGVSRIGWGEWLLLVVATLGVQGALWLVVATGVHKRLTNDPRFIFLPSISAALLLNLYISFAPEGRILALMGWLVALLFLAGLASFREILALSSVMVGAYTFVIGLHQARGFPFSLPYEISVIVVFAVILLYQAIVFHRLRRERLEMHRLREELVQLAATDALTGLPNRRVFEGYLGTELNRLRRYGGTSTIAMIDVDHFKVFNDTHGHIAGDAALKALADLMREKLRTTDVVARFGGEEFTILMVNTPKDEAIQAMDRLRVVVEGWPFDGEEVLPEGRFTISAGLAAFPDDGRDYQSILVAADDALYEAKRHGRNQVGVVMPADA